MTKILVHIEIDVLNEGAEFDSYVQLVESHVPGVEMSDLQGGWLGPGLVDELHHLSEHVTPANVGEAGQALHQLGVPGHSLRGLEEDDGL